MKSNKIIMTIAAAVAVIGIFSLINTSLLNNITGHSILNLSEEFQGIGVLLVIILCIIGIAMIRKHHK